MRHLGFSRASSLAAALVVGGLAVGGCRPHNTLGVSPSVAVVAVASGAPAPAATTALAVASAPRPGPIPDYEPVAHIYTHMRVDMLSEALPELLTELVGDVHTVEDYDPPPPPDEVDETTDRSLVWLRDYQPIYVRRANGRLKLLRYLSENPNRAVYMPLDAERAAIELHTGQAPDIETLPLLHENGNLVAMGRFIFVTERLLEQNAEPHEEPHLLQAGYEPRDPDAVLALLAEAFERPVADIVVLPRLPGELTGHVDLFLMALDEKTVVVPQIRAEALALGGTVAGEAEMAVAVQRFLDEVADRLDQLELDVVRLPMVAPLYLPAEYEDAGDDWDYVYYSPANSLLVRTGLDARVLVPEVDLGDQSLALSFVERAYEGEWSAVLAAHGWTAVPVEATRLGRYLGLLRCVSATEPAFGSLAGG